MRYAHYVNRQAGCNCSLSLLSLDAATRASGGVIHTLDSAHCVYGIPCYATKEFSQSVMNHSKHGESVIVISS